MGSTQIPWTEDAAERRSELVSKRSQITAWMADRQLEALLIARHENIAWATAGLVDIRVGTLRETGIASLLILRDGSGYYISTNNEQARLQAEEFAELDLKPLINPWHANSLPDTIASVVGKGKVAGDIALPGAPAVSLYELRETLTPGEIARYRWLGQSVADAVTEVALLLQPGVSERAMQAMLGERLIRRGILPSVYLTSVDDRVRSFPHPVPRDGVLQHFGMVGLCARRWGLVAAITRFVHFGPVPDELTDKFGVVASVNAQLLHATVPGATSDALFQVAQQAYAELGHPGAEQNHHQGGATGYIEREWFARPGGTEQVHSRQAFAWNPSLRGAKCEDTVLYHDGALEILTKTPRLPETKASVNGQEYSFADILKR